MAKIQANTPKGMRDFGPEQMRRRRFLFQTLESLFLEFGYQAIETPSMELLETLTGKYGEEGDRLIFKVLNSGDFFKKLSPVLAEGQSPDAKKHLPLLSEKALRYDLTIPFARFVAQHQNEISFPFKRYQMQPVWRADSPQKGRYREFYQCDVDVLGSDSLFLEAEMIRMYAEGFARLGLPNIQIQINHRGVLAGIAEAIQAPEQLRALTVTLDKMDKLPLDTIKEILQKEGFSVDQIRMLDPILALGSGDTPELMAPYIGQTQAGSEAIHALREVFELSLAPGPLAGAAQLVFNPCLARGLDYYTGCIFEVTLPGSGMGSLGGGGRYDNLTEMFGLNSRSGIGVSFGAERIYDILEAQQAWPKEIQQGPDFFFLHFDRPGALKALSWMEKLRQAGHTTLLYPEAAKIQKQMKYADSQGARFVCSLGSEELAQRSIQIKAMESGEKVTLSDAEFAERINQGYYGTH